MFYCVFFVCWFIFVSCCLHLMEELYYFGRVMEREVVGKWHLLLDVYRKEIGLTSFFRVDPT